MNEDVLFTQHLNLRGGDYCSGGMIHTSARMITAHWHTWAEPTLTIFRRGQADRSECVKTDRQENGGESLSRGRRRLIQQQSHIDTIYKAASPPISHRTPSHAGEILDGAGESRRRDHLEIASWKLMQAHSSQRSAPPH